MFHSFSWLFVQPVGACKKEAVGNNVLRERAGFLTFAILFSVPALPDCRPDFR
jgi:hypothetical protein